MTRSTTGGALYWEAGIDPQALYNEIAKINEKLKTLADNTAKEGERMDDVFKKLGLAIGGYLSIDALAGFGQKVIQVRGEFQQLGIAMETMLGNKAKADSMMSEMIQFAAKTPFTLTDVASNAKQLMAMGVASENVIDTLKSLGDVAAGVSVPLERVAINYGQVLTMGTLQGRELRDFAMAGIPLLEELAKNLGKTKAEITDMVSAGAIGFKEVETAFQTMAGEGGKFANLMEKQNSSVTGQISNLQDKMAVMFNSIGKANEGIIYSGISSLAEVINNYQEILDILKVLIATYGAYKAVLITTVAIQKAAAISGNVVAWFQLAAGIRSAKDAQIAFNLAVSANPYALAIAGLALVTAALVVYQKKARTSEEVTDSLNKSIKGLGEGSKNLDDLMKTYNDLNVKVSRSDAENKKLAETMNLIGSAVKGAVTEFDKYGNALGINVEKVKTYTESIKAAFKIAIEADVKEKEKELKDLQKEVEQQREIYEKGKITSIIATGGNAAYGISGTSVVSRKATQEEMEKAARQVRDIQEKITNVQNTIAAGKSAIDGIVSAQATSTEKHVQTVAEAIAEIDKQIADITSARSKLAATDLKGMADYAKKLDDLEKQKKAFEGKNDADLKKADKEQEARNAASEELEKLHIANLEEFANWEAGVGAKRIANMEEGLAKEQAQNKLAFETRKKEIEREKEQTLALLNKEAGIKPGQKGQITELSKEQKADYLQKMNAARKDWEDADLKSAKVWAEKINDIWSEVYAATLTGYEKEIQANKRKYDQMAKDARKANDPELSKAVERERVKAIEAINNAHALDIIDIQEQVQSRKNEILANGFDRESRLEALNFQTWLIHQKRRLAILQASNNEKDRQQAEVLAAEIEAGTNENNLKTELKIRTLIVNSAQQLVDIAGQYNSELGTALGGLLSLGKGIDTAVTKGASLTKADAANMAITGLSNIANMVINSYAERKRVADEFYRATIKQQMEYNLLLNDQLRLNSDINGTLFVQNYEGRLIDSTNAYNNAQGKFAEEFKKFQDAQAIIAKKNVVSGTNVLAGAGSGALAGAAIGTIFPGIGTAVGAAVGGLVGLIGGLFAKKSKDVVAPLLETYKDLITPAGEFNLELAKTLVDSGKLTNETNEVLKNLIQWKEAAEKAREQLRQVITDLTGSLGDDMRNALVSAFKDGTDSAMAFGDSVDKVLENITTNMIFNKVFEGAFKKLQQGMEASYEAGGDQTWLDDFKAFLDQKQTLTDQFNTEMQNAKDAAKTQGFDIFQTTTDNKSPATLSGQIQRTITEATGSELAGMMRKISDDNRMNRDYNRQAVTHLAMIQANTRRTADNTDRLERIDTSLIAIEKNTRQGATPRDLGN